MSLGDALLQALLEMSKGKPLDIEKERPSLIKEMKISILDTITNSMTAFRMGIHGFSHEESLRIAHAALAHTLGYFEEAIKSKEKNAFAKEGEDFDEVISKIRAHNIALGKRHVRFHMENADKGVKERCADNHFVDNTDLSLH